MARAFGTELYEAFIAVAESGGFTAAADRLHRTQTTISQQVRRLETALDRRLFARTSRRVRLTAAGTAVLPFARQILRLHAQAALAVQGAIQEPLRLGVPDQYAEAVLPGFLALLRDYTAAAPVVHCDQSVELFERFSHGELDVIVTSRYPNFPAGRTVSIEQLVWVGCAGYRPPPDRPLPLVLFPEGCPFRARALAALRYAEREWEVVYTGQSGTALHAPLKLGLGITVMSRRTIPPGMEEIDAGCGLPPVQTAALDLHLGVPVIEQYGRVLEEQLRASAARALGAAGGPAVAA